MLTLDKILQRQGFGTRRECRRLIREGSVSIDGKIQERFDEDIDTDGLEFIVDGERWTYREQIYVVLHKPAGYECSRNPTHHQSVLSLLPAQLIRRGAQPVGRLDHDTTGLLLFSDDGKFIHAQSSPKRHVPKTYVATTQDPVTPELVEGLCKGIQLNDEPGPLSAISAARLDTNLVEIVLDQGKYHQVKRMLAAAGNHCVALQRTAIGRLTLDSLSLKSGEWGYLEEEWRALLG